MSTVTVAVYHYVRDLAATRFPALKARDLRDFRAQLDHFAGRYEVVTAEQVMAAALGEQALPADACWLTFDDGYADHYQNVFPLLAERNWQGSFFVPSHAVGERELLDVNKVHFVLAATDRPDGLIDDIEAFCDERRQAGDHLEAREEYRTRHLHPNRWDPAEVVFVKRMLQRGLPEDLRRELADRLFRRHVTDDVVGFAAELYLDREQLRAMVDADMYVGSHGSAHHWLDSLDAEAQAVDIDESLRFLHSVGADSSRWVMCYPYGAYNQDTLAVLRDRHCTLGLTTISGHAEVPGDPPLELPRVDTNDLPVA